MTAEAGVLEASRDTPALVWRGPLLVGRERELAQVLAHLESGRTRVIGVAAGPSYGKTLFLAAVESAARERGWSTARRDADGQALTIAAGTTEGSLVEQVRAQLGMAAGERDRLGSTDPAVPPGRLLVEDLAARGPCVLLIDDFRPTPAVRAWLTTRFLPELRVATAPLVAVVAGLPDAIEALRGSWDELVTLGPLPRQAVRTHFDAIASACRPPLTADEITAYVQESLEKPHVLNALTLLLAKLNAAQSESEQA